MDIITVPRDNLFKSDILDLFERVDADATGTHYDASTADVARSLCLTDLAASVSDRTALACFYESLTDTAVLAFQDYELLGFSLVATNDQLFTRLLPDCTPHIAIHFSAVHPEYRRNGVWTALRDEIETTLASKHNAEYLVTAASKENTASRTANESRNLTQHEELASDFEDSTTIMYAKPLDN